MRQLQRWTIKALLHVAGLGATVVVTIIVVFAAQAVLRHPDLEAWHDVVLREEFAVEGANAPESFEAYRALEARLFTELRERVLADPAAAGTRFLSRYNPQSMVAQLAYDTPYNHSFELVPVGEPRGAVLLVHGLTDSPYHMRGVAETFLAQRYYVLVLRLPGHGTLPAGLLGVRWTDWLAAVTLGARHAAARAGQGRPFLVGGHSTGAALVTLYTVRSLDDPTLPRPQGVYLVSAAIGITPFAALTNVVAVLGRLPWLAKARWIDVLPEYDPYKYNSFPVNAARQIHTLTRALRTAIDDAERGGSLAAMPRVTVFQSIVDSTVTAPEVVRGLLGRLPGEGHELVVFDVNRTEVVQSLLAPGPIEDLEALRNASDLPFRLSLIGSAAPETRAVALYSREAGESAVRRQALPLAWPPGVFSLGHVALPIPPDDPVYGLDPSVDEGRPRFNLGAVPVRGESGALLTPLGTFARLRSNPFFDVIRSRIVATLPDGGA